MNIEKRKVIDTLIIIDVTIMILFNIISIFLLVYQVHWRTLNSIFYVQFLLSYQTGNGMFYYYFIFVLLCLIKLIITIIKQIKTKKLKAKIYKNNIIQLFTSFLYIIFIIMTLFDIKFRKINILDFGYLTIISLFIMAFCLPIFQIYFTNYMENKKLSILSNIITPITSLLLNSVFPYVIMTT